MDSRCPTSSDTNPSNGHDYALTDPLTWHGAEAAGVAEGGHLVAVNDAAEHAWLLATFGDQELFWIGLSDEASEGTFGWSNGDPVTFTNWNGGEPNNATNEDWVHMNWAVPGGWNDFEAGADYTDASGFFHAQNDSFPQRGIIEVSRGVPDGGATLGMLGAATALLAFARRRF